MKHTKFALIAVVSILLLVSCQPASHFTSGRLTQAREDASYLYTLPKTVIRLEFTFVKRTIVPGPYSSYAQRYLSITDAVHDRTTQYEIASISAENITEPDYKHMYYIEDKGADLDRDQLFFLTEQGLLINPSLVSGYDIHESNVTRLTEKNPFTEFLIHKNLRDYTRKAYNATRADTAFNTPPYSKETVQSSTVEGKARDVANAILRIREWRLDLIGGQLDFMPGGESMDRVLQELDHIESEYMALFTGREYYDTARTTLFFIPAEQSVEEHKTLFYFSEENGPSELYQNGSLPIEMHMFNKSNAPVASSVPDDSVSEPVQDKIFYRIPGTAAFHLTFNTRQLLKERIPVYQYGVLTTLRVRKTEK